MPERIAGWMFIVLALSKGAELLFSSPGAGVDAVLGVQTSVISALMLVYELALGLFLLMHFCCVYKGAFLLLYCIQIISYKVISAALADGAACSCLGVISKEVLGANHLTGVILTWLLLAYFLVTALCLFARGENHNVRRGRLPSIAAPILKR